MRLSTRNQFPGTVVSITKGEAMAVVKVAVDGTDLVVLEPGASHTVTWGIAAL